MKRMEFKYLIPVSLIDDIRKEIRPFVEPDPYAVKCENGTYTVRSIYLDTADFECYRIKIEGMGIRKKYRIRGYNAFDRDSIVFLEIKRKNINHIHKDRAPLKYTNLQTFLGTKDFDRYILSFSRNGKEKDAARQYLYHVYARGLRPVVLVIYEREAFTGRFDTSLRLTLDKNLRSSIYPSLNNLFDEMQIKFAMTQYYILEVKFDSSMPAWLGSVLKRHELQRKTLSKYTICIDSHNSLYRRSVNRTGPVTIHAKPVHQESKASQHAQ